MIDLKNITKKYKNKIILENVNYTFPNKGFVCIFGSSGSGKTTLLNLLAGFDTDFSGEITIGDIKIHDCSKDELCELRRDNIGFVFQNYHLLTGLTVLENVLMPLGLSKKNRIENEKKAISLLESLSILEKKDQVVETLSGGEKQRVAIARALIHQPFILFADEPTGALDRRNSKRIMDILKELAKNHLIIMITHDEKISNLADEIVKIENKKIVIVKKNSIKRNEKFYLKHETSKKVSAIHQAFLNFRVHKKRFLAVSAIMAVGLLLFTLSLSTINLVEKSTYEFKLKNTAFNNGYIKGNDEKTFETLLKDKRIDNVYRQYKMNHISLQFDEKKETLEEHFPMPKTKESLSYGVMPRKGKEEIALSPSLAKKFSSDIQNLVGKEIIIKIGNIEKKLNISGIFNAAYDDFFLSSDIEQEFYKNADIKNCYAISYDVKEFQDIESVSMDLEKNGIKAVTAVLEVSNLNQTFEGLSRLFLVLSIIILIVGFIISTILLMKLQSTRYQEMGLLAALGFKKSFIRSMLFYENFILSSISSIFTLIICSLIFGLQRIINLEISLKFSQIVLAILLTFFFLILISSLLSVRLLKKEPAECLKM